MTKEAVSVGCDEPWFSLLRQGIKTVEGRRASPRWSDLRIGDTVRFHESLGGATFFARIRAIRTYEPPDALRSYLHTEGLESTLPHPAVATLEDGERVYAAFWSKESIDAAGGMLAIEIEIVA